MKTQSLFASALIVGAAALLPSAAQASINITNYALANGYTSGNLLIDNPSPTADFAVNGVGIGRITLTGNDTVTSAAVSFTGYCIDIMDFLHAGLFDIVPLVSYAPLNPTQKAQLLALVSNADPLLNAATPSNTISAGIQLAVWEIVYETGGTFNAGSGIFKATTDAAAIAKANEYLGYVSGGTWTAQAGYQLNTLVALNGANQEQLFLIKSPVPEPATWAMMIAGFGLVGASLRARRKLAQAALA